LTEHVLSVLRFPLLGEGERMRPAQSYVFGRRAADLKALLASGGALPPDLTARPH